MVRRSSGRTAASPPDGEAIARILLVDEVRRFLDLLKNYLKRATCRVLTARTGAEALALCRKERPGLVFLDAGLPGADGLAICRALKDDPLLRAIPVVLLAPAERQDECHAAGCDAVVAKPVTQEAFLEQVRRFVDLLERQEHRIPVSVRTELQVGTATYTAFTKDLSPHGTFLKSPRPFPSGTRLRLTLQLPGGRPPLVLGAEVRRVIGSSAGSHLLPGVGVRFDDVPAEARAVLEDFIAERLRR